MVKKSFKDAALSFVSIPEPEIQKPEECITDEDPPQKEIPVIISKPSIPAGFKPNYQYIETKSKRLQLLIQPSLFAKLKEAAAENATSVNNLINQILLEAMKKV